MTFMHTKIDHQRSAEVEEWIKEEAEEQELRYQRIAKEMDDLKSAREVWYEEFFYRIENKGFNTDGDDRMKIKPEDIPVKPQGREDRVIWKYGEQAISNVEK